MPFTKIIACVIVKEKDQVRVAEEFEVFLDSFVKRRIPIFDSAVSTTLVCEAEDAEEIEEEDLLAKAKP